VDDVWEEKAEWWRDTFASGEDPEYVEQILPLIQSHIGSAQTALDVGTGEGQVARLLKEHGVERVTAIDGSTAMLEEARKRGGDIEFIQCGVTSMPFESEIFDLVTTVLVLEHVEPIKEAIAEIARVLKPGGRFLFLLNHPLLQTPNSGWIDDHILEEQYWRIGAYLVEDTTLEEVEPGVKIPFVHRPLSVYVNALAAGGLLVREMIEPAPPPGFIAQADEYSDAATIPRLLFLDLEKNPVPKARLT
jgi:SAM-dependent methyltransferase